jgi:hypothetical protein
MARNHAGQMALYEAVNRERFKAAQKKELSRVVPDQADNVEPALRPQPVTIPPQQPKNADVKQSVWTKKPKMFGLNNGRIEIFLPYLHAVTILMVLLFLLVVSYTIGHTVGKNNTEEFSAKNTDTVAETTATLDTVKVAKEMARSAVAKYGTATPAASSTTTESAAKGGEGENVIVLAELKNTSNAKDLEPAKQYFDEHGIATEIIKNYHGSCLLVTKEKYDGFSRGTAGAAIIEKIGQIGAKYKAPAGYGGFGSKPFSDAYGRKM